MPRGGRRAGAPGKSYGNRSDLNVVRQLPVTSAPGQEYGQATAQRDAQRQVPMASGDLSRPGPRQAATADPADVMAQAQAYQPPPVVPLTAPTGRPGEPLMTPPTPTPSTQGALLSSAALLNSLGDDASPAVKALRNVLAAGQANAGAP